ncbi:MAG: hypothetical protein IPN97_07890 [Saprospiraceae bacterium]|nr:hypothetical protein [Saprospiraceae bacterium]
MFFCGVIIYVFRMKKSKSEDFARIPKNEKYKQYEIEKFVFIYFI